MRISLAYAEDIIGVEGANIEFIRRTSGAILTVQESKGLPKEITVEIKETSSQVQDAQRLIQTLDIAKNAVALALSPVVRAIVDPDRAMRDVRYLDNDHRGDQDDTLE